MRTKRPRRHSGIQGIRSTVAALLLTGIAACGSPQRVSHANDEAAANAALSAAAYEDFLRAELLAEIGEWEEALAALQRAIDADPSAPTLYLRAANAAAHIDGESDRGLRYAGLAEDLDAPAADVAMARAELHWSADAPDAAIAVLAALPNDDATHETFALWLAVGNDADDAYGARRAAAERYTEAYPEDGRSWRALGDAVRHDAPAEAADAYGRALALPDPNGGDAYLQIQLLADLGRTDDALAAASTCREQLWEYWPCTAWQVRLLDTGRAEDAPVSAETREAMEHLAFMVSTDARQLAQSGAELRESESPSLLSAYAETLADTRPYNVNVITTAAWFANGVENYDLAVTLMERVLELDDANFDALNYIGYTWAEAGENLEQAEVYIREALFLRGDDGNILDSLAWVYFRMGRFEDALEVQLRAMEFVDDSAVMWDHLGDMYEALGRTDEAIAAWERALELADEYDEDVLDDAPRKIEAARGVS